MIKKNQKPDGGEKIQGGGEKVQDRVEEKIRFFSDLEQGLLGIPDSIRRMRKITRKTQPKYAELVNVAPRVLIDLERGIGNPTRETLEKIGKPFGLKIIFYKPIKK